MTKKIDWKHFNSKSDNNVIYNVVITLRLISKFYQPSFILQWDITSFIEPFNWI